MVPNVACGGECIYDNFKLEYQVVSLEYIRNKSIKIEAICYNPFNSFDKEAVLKFSTNNIHQQDERLSIAISIVSSFIKHLKLSEDKLRKLIVKDKEVFHISVI